MKNLMIATFLLITMLGCKDNSKKDEIVTEPNMNEESMETVNSANEKLELGCYVYKTSGYNVKMEVTNIADDMVFANLFYEYAQKDKNEGTFSGQRVGDKLFGQYTFMSEGKESVRDVAFKIEKDQIIEGFGELDEKGTKFADTTKITYSSTTPWKKANCN